MSDILRITGMVTGMDTDQMVEDLIKAEQTRVDRVKQDKQYTEWKQEAYRDIINEIRTFKDEYFNYLNTENNMRSTTTFNSNTTTLADSNLSEYITINANSNAMQDNYTISNIVLAEEAKATGSHYVTGDVVGSSLTTPITIDSSNNQFYINFNGNNETITIANGDYNTLEDFRAEIETRINETFGSGKMEVQLTGGSSDQLLFTSDSTNNFTLSEVSNNDGLAIIGFDDANLSNKINLNSNLGDITNKFATTLSVAGTDDDISFTVNDQTFNFSSAVTSLNDIMDEINESDINVTMRYDELNDKFIVQSDDTGDAAEVEVNDVTGNLMDVLGLDGQCVNGSDATIDYDAGGDGINVQTITRASNKFSFNGINIELEKNYAGNIDFAVSSNADEVVEKITGFVESYNKLIDSINTELSEERFYDYKPLTDAQKEEMEEEDIELWEEKAKSGILKNEGNLENMLNNMRKAFYENVQGTDISLYEMGITTSVNYEERGKLVIDENQLRETIEDDPAAVTEFFATDGDNYEEDGLSQRLYDIVENNIRTTRDGNGYKGILLEKAGIEGDSSQHNNILSNDIEKYDEQIEELLEEISDKEDYYYNMFAKMESAIAQMNNQSAWLMNQMGTGGTQ